MSEMDRGDKVVWHQAGDLCRDSGPGPRHKVVTKMDPNHPACALLQVVGGNDARPDDHGRLDRAEPLANPARVSKRGPSCVLSD